MFVKTFIMVEIVQFGRVNFAVFGIMLFLSTAIGINHALTEGKRRTMKEFLFANRGMIAIPVTLSLIASFMSAITILGVPAEIYIWYTVLAYHCLLRDSLSICGADFRSRVPRCRYLEFLRGELIGIRLDRSMVRSLQVRSLHTEVRSLH